VSGTTFFGSMRGSFTVRAGFALMTESSTAARKMATR
jgi:hypothetical protein